MSEDECKPPDYFDNYKLLKESTRVFKFHGTGKIMHFMAAASSWFACEAMMHKPRDASEWSPLGRFMEISVKHKVLFIATSFI